MRSPRAREKLGTVVGLELAPWLRSVMLSADDRSDWVELTRFPWEEHLPSLAQLV